MPDNQEIANGIGATIRAAEQAAENEGATETATHLTSLHEQLGQAFNAANVVLQAAGQPLLDWNAAAGNNAARGGTPKGPAPTVE